ncbi:MAG: hypothetical protein OXR64_07675 [Chloroflexota bacterium]|nr:hypothetical protein [Chloroflexota bacterium]
MKLASLAMTRVVPFTAGLRIHQQLTGPARIYVVRLGENTDEQASVGLGIVRHTESGSVHFTNWTSS